MKRLREGLEKTMYGPPGAIPPVLGILLVGLEKIYGAAVRRRARGFAAGDKTVHRLDRPVVAVGNLTLGGTGKTPMVRWAARRLGAMGVHVAVLSRGYAGGAERRGAAVSDGRRMLLDARTAGDEPFLLALDLPGVAVVVGRDRAAMGRLVQRTFTPDVFLLDDGFQHRRLARDLDLVLLDARQPLGNGHLLPRGPLREPPAALRRADAVVLTRADRLDPAQLAAQVRRLKRWTGTLPILTARDRPFVANRSMGTLNGGPPPVTGLVGRRGYAFAGLARNAAFFQGLRAMGVHLAGQASFADHHWYSGRDLNDIAARAAAAGAEVLLTTAKDHARLPPGRRWPLPLIVLDIDMDLGDDAAVLEGMLANVLNKNKTRMTKHPSTKHEGMTKSECRRAATR